MLVLTRKAGETFTIGAQAEVQIKLLDIDGGRIRLGIEADPSIPIRRGDLRSSASGQARVPKREREHVVEFAREFSALDARTR